MTGRAPGRAWAQGWLKAAAPRADMRPEGTAIARHPKLWNAPNTPGVDVLLRSQSMVCSGNRVSTVSMPHCDHHMRAHATVQQAMRVRPRKSAYVLAACCMPRFMNDQNMGHDVTSHARLLQTGPPQPQRLRS